ncbi:hypothetical protein Tco_0313800 [Tanacetum coccineum]
MMVNDFIHPRGSQLMDDDIIQERKPIRDSFDPTIHTPSRISSSDDEDSDNEVEGTNVEGAKSDEDATYEEDQGNEAVEDTNTNLDGSDDVMTDVILPQVQATQEIEDTHVTLTPVNPDGQQQSSSVSSGFVSNMLNPNQDTGVDDIFGQHTEATSLIDTPVTAIMEPSFTAQTIRPPTSNPLVIQTQQPPILTPATTTSSSLQNLPNFASLFGFDYRLKALEDNFSELRQTNQYAEALSSIPGIVDQYLANKMQEAVDVAVQLKYDRIREESNTANQQFPDPIELKKEENYQERSPTFKLIKGTCKSLTELEYFCEEVYKATTERLDWINPEGRQYPHDLPQPLPLVPNSQGRHIMAYQMDRRLRAQLMWSQIIVKYDKFALLGKTHIVGKKAKTFTMHLRSQGDSACDVYSKRQIIAVTKVEIVEWQNYKPNLDWITVRRDDDIHYQVLSDIEDSHGPSDAMHNPLPATQSQKDFVSKLTEIHSFLLTLSLRNIRVNSFTMKMEILLEPTSNKLMVEHAEYDESNTYVLERFNTTAGNPVKKILLKLNLSDHRLCKMVVEVPDSSWLTRSIATCSYPTDKHKDIMKAQHVGPEVASPQDGKVSRWQRDCAWLMISRCSRSQCQIQVQGTSSIQEVNDHYNIFTRESQEYELKTKDKAYTFYRSFTYFITHDTTDLPSPVASPATAEAEGFLTELGAQRYDRDIGELFTRSEAVRDEIFSQRYRLRSLKHEQERVAMENRELRLQIVEERRARLDLAEIVASMRRGQEPRGDV